MSAPSPDDWAGETPCPPEELDPQERLRRAEVERERAVAQAQVERRRKRRALTGLLLAFVAVLIIGGWSAWRFVRTRATEAEQERRAADEREIDLALADIRQRLEDIAASDDPERDAAELFPAFAIVERVEALVRDGKGNEEHRTDIVRARHSLDRAYRDLLTIAELDRIRLDSIDARERRIEPALLARRYAEAFAALGIETGPDRAMAASRSVRMHPNRERLLTALSNWRIVEPDRKKKDSLAYLLRIVEAKDGYRSRLRDALLRRDDPLVGTMLESPDLEQQPPLYLCRLSVLLRSINRENQALDVLQRGVNRHPGDFWVNTEMGGAWLYRRPNGPTTAREHFKAAVAIRPHSAGANYLLGVASRRVGHYSDAKNALLRAIEADANFADAHLHLCAILQTENDLEGAIQHGQRATELSSGNPAPASQLAAAYLAQGNGADALDWYRKALAADGNYVPALLGLGELLREEGQIEEAGLLLKRAADAAPERSAALNQYGLILQAKGDLAGAAVMFQKAMDAERQDPAACVYYGIVQGRLGDRDEAVRWFQAAIARDPKYAPAYVQLGLDHYARTQYRESASRLQQAIDYDPRSAAAQFHLGRALKQSGDLNGALAAFRKAAELKPQWVEAHFLQGMSAFELSLFEEAAAALLRAARLCPVGNPVFGPVHIFLQRAKRQISSLERGAIRKKGQTLSSQSSGSGSPRKKMNVPANVPFF